jgi:hypothetical protein
MKISLGSKGLFASYSTSCTFSVSSFSVRHLASPRGTSAQFFFSPPWLRFMRCMMLFKLRLGVRRLVLRHRMMGGMRWLIPEEAAMHVVVGGNLHSRAHRKG